MRIPLALPPAGRSAFDVVGCGLNMVDLLVTVSSYPEANSKQPVESIEHSPGGQVASAMVACARLGVRACYVGRFGDDENGRRGRESLEAEGVDTSRAFVAPSTRNGFSVILVDRTAGTRTVLWSRDPRLRLQADEVDEAAVCAGRTLLVDCHDTAASTVAAAHARAAAIPTVVDVEHVRDGVEQLLANIDIIIAAETFPEAVTGRESPGAALETLQRQTGAAVVCMTLGAAGSLARVGGREIRTPGYRVTTVDTTGAGDVFRGGFIAGWVRGGADAAVDDVLRYANAVAALKCRGIGARRAIPEPDEVDALLRGEAM